MSDKIAYYPRTPRSTQSLWIWATLLFAAFVVGLFLGDSADAQTLPVTITASPTSGNAPLSTTLTWSATGATACTASGSWTGSKAATGTQTVTNLTASATYKLDCTGPVSTQCVGSVSIEITPPATNTDGSAIGAAGIRLFRGLNGSIPVQRDEWLNLQPRTAVYGALCPGTYQYFARSFQLSASARESDNSNFVEKIIPANAPTTGHAEVTVTVTDPVPSPPTIRIVTDPTAYEIKTNSAGTLVATRIGLVPLGTTCSERQQKVGAVTYRLVPRDQIDMVNWPANVKLVDIWAKCG